MYHITANVAIGFVPLPETGRVESGRAVLLPQVEAEHQCFLIQQADLPKTFLLLDTHAMGESLL